MCVPEHVCSHAGRRSLFRAIEQSDMEGKLKMHLEQKVNTVNSAEQRVYCAFSF